MVTEANKNESEHADADASEHADVLAQLVLLLLKPFKSVGAAGLDWALYDALVHQFVHELPFSTK